MGKKKSQGKSTSPESKKEPKKRWKRPAKYASFGKGLNWHKVLAKKLRRQRELNRRWRMYCIDTKFLELF